MPVSAQTGHFVPSNYRKNIGCEKKLKVFNQPYDWDPDMPVLPESLKQPKQ